MLLSCLLRCYLEEAHCERAISAIECQNQTFSMQGKYTQRPCVYKTSMTMNVTGNPRTFYIIFIWKVICTQTKTKCSPVVNDEMK